MSLKVLSMSAGEHDTKLESIKNSAKHALSPNLPAEDVLVFRLSIVSLGIFFSLFYYLPSDLIRRGFGVLGGC